MNFRFRKKARNFDVLIIIVGHDKSNFLIDTAESIEFFHKTSSLKFHIVFAIDGNEICAEEIIEKRGSESVYCGQKNGWGRGIMRTLAHAIDHFTKNGIRFEHLLTVDSDTLAIGPFLDDMISKIDEETYFVGRKWGGDEPFGSMNPGPDIFCLSQLKFLANLFEERPWTPLNYMVAGPLMLWTRKTLNFLYELGIFPGLFFDEIYPFVLFPHDQMSSFVLGFHPKGFRDLGESAMLYCGGVGGKEDWKTGLPVKNVGSYGNIPIVPDHVSVIHPVRSKYYEEAAVRNYYQEKRID